MATESATLVGASEGYRLWSATYDRDPNPILALERGVIAERLGPLSGRCLIDIGAGTGYWPAYAQGRGARAYGVDVCEAMLRQATAKPGLRGRLVLADMDARLPFKDQAAEIAVCSLSIGYLPSVGRLFGELARVARTVIVSDLHEHAVQAGWRRCFESNGRQFEIEQFEHTVRELDEAAAGAGLLLAWRVASHLGEAERQIFIRAGREHAFEKATGIHAILSTCWIRT